MRRAQAVVNARSETAFEKPFFLSAMRARRALMPADGFYEWTTEAGGKQPSLFEQASGGRFAPERRGGMRDLRLFGIVTRFPDLFRPSNPSLSSVRATSSTIVDENSTRIGIPVIGYRSDRRDSSPLWTIETR